MKKLLSLMMVAVMLLAVSCNKPQEFLGDEGDLASIHFSVMGDLMTKANSDFATGTKVDKLKVQAFIKGSDNAYHLTNANITITPVTGASPLAWDVDMKLAKNRAYKIAFFAYKDGTGIYGVDDLSAITVDYSKIAINSDDADAFCAARSLTVAGALSETVELYRPLAQLNIGVSDWEEYKNSTLDEMQDITVAISVNSVPNGLNLIGGETAADGSVAATTSGAGAVEFARVDVLDVDDELVTGYDYFSMVYVLASKDKENMTFTADFEFGDETSVDISNIEITNMPFQANYRTNVLGQLLTGNIHYDVEIVPGFMTPDYVATMIEQAVETSSDLAAAMAANKDVTSQEYEVNEVVKDNADANTATIEIPDNTTSTSITFDLNSVESGVTEIIIKDQTPANESSNFQNTVIVEVPASVDLDAVTVTVQAPDAHVILKQGDYSTVVASTSGSTLVVEAGAVVDLIKVVTGNVSIDPAATVTRVERAEGNTATVKVFVSKGAPAYPTCGEGVELVYGDIYGVTKEEADNAVTYTVSASANSGALAAILEEVNANPVKDVTINVAAGATIEWATGAGHGSTPLIPADNTVTENVYINGGTFMTTGAGVGPIRAANGGKFFFKDVTIVDHSVSYAESSWEFGYLELAGAMSFEDCDIQSALTIQDEEGSPADVSFSGCSFTTETEVSDWVPVPSNMYMVWVSDGKVAFDKCTFSGFRGIKIHEAYGSDVDEVLIENCLFPELIMKPCVAIGTVNATTKISILNCTYGNVQAGDQGLYIYETDTDVTTFDFTEEGTQMTITVGGEGASGFEQ